MTLGKLVPPYPRDTCCAADCGKPFVPDDRDAFMYRDLDSGKLVIFCDDCARRVELRRPPRFLLVPL